MISPLQTDADKALAEFLSATSTHLTVRYSPPVNTLDAARSLSASLGTSYDRAVIFDRHLSKEDWRALKAYRRTWPRDLPAPTPYLSCATCHKFSRESHAHCRACAIVGAVEEQCTNCRRLTCCCQCVACEGCECRTSTPCRHCHLCSDCCECASCSNCGARVPEQCEDCGYGLRGCRSNGRGCCSCVNVTYVTEGAPWNAAHPSLRRGFRLTRLVGVEWEFNYATEGRPINRWADRWRGGIHHDGSCGHECVTAPLAGDHIAKCLADLGAAFASGGAQANKTCGLHVHVDAKDIRWHEMYRLIQLYAYLEPLLYLLGGVNRPTNSYCRPCGKQYIQAIEKADPKGALLGTAIYESPEMCGRDHMKGTPQKKGGGRYRGLNLNPWIARFRKRDGVLCPDSTVEFRIHENTLDAARVISWTHLLASLVEWAAIKGNSDVARIVQGGQLAALSEVSPGSEEYISKQIEAWSSNHGAITGSPERGFSCAV